MTEFDLLVEKMRKYCLYSDRCHSDVRSKLIKEKIFGDELEEVISILIQEDFLNEERFAKAFTIGKFHQNKWGKKRIEMELKRRKVSSYCLKKGLDSIPEEEYIEAIRQLWEKKYASLRDESEYTKKQKTTKFLIGKGYEYDVIKSIN